MSLGMGVGKGAKASTWFWNLTLSYQIFRILGSSG